MIYNETRNGTRVRHTVIIASAANPARRCAVTGSARAGIECNYSSTNVRELERAGTSATRVGACSIFAVRRALNRRSLAVFAGRKFRSNCVQTSA